MPWCDPWNANQLTTDAPLEPRPVSRTQTSKPEVVTDLIHSAAGSWILVCSFPWLIVAITFTLPRPWNAAVNDTDWQPWLLCVKSDILTFPAWKEVAKEYRKKQQCWTDYAIVTAWSIEVNSIHQCHKDIPLQFTFFTTFRVRFYLKGSATTTTPQINDVIGWIRKNNRATCAARFLAQFFDVICQTMTWSFHIWSSHATTRGCSSKFSFPLLHENYSCQTSERTLRLFRATWRTCNNRKTLNVPQSALLSSDVFVAAAVVTA